MYGSVLGVWHTKSFALGGGKGEVVTDVSSMSPSEIVIYERPWRGDQGKFYKWHGISRGRRQEEFANETR